MKKTLTYKGAVMTWETDSNGHMNVMYYINKYEHGARNFILELGLLEDSITDAIGLVVLEQQIKYYQEVFEDDLLYIESSLLEIGNKAFTIYHEMYNARTKMLVSTMKAVSVFFDKKNRTALAFPEDKRKLLTPDSGD